MINIELRALPLSILISILFIQFHRHNHHILFFYIYFNQKFPTATGRDMGGEDEGNWNSNLQYFVWNQTTRDRYRDAKLSSQQQQEQPKSPPIITHPNPPHTHTLTHTRAYLREWVREIGRGRRRRRPTSTCTCDIRKPFWAHLSYKLH